MASQSGCMMFVKTFSSLGFSLSPWANVRSTGNKTHVLRKKVNFTPWESRNISTSIFLTSPTLSKRYIPRRVLMYVPGNDDRKIRKIPTLNADCVALDCEDGVASNKKDEARKTVRQILDSGSVNFGRTECTVRVNSVESGLCAEDLEVILPTKKLPSSIHIPKVDHPDHLRWFAETATKHLSATSYPRKINLIIFVESAKSILALPQICKTAWDLSEKYNFVPDALVFGSDDYVADIGATRTKEATELMYARQYIVMVAKAFKLQAIDIVHIDFKDEEGLRKQAIEGALMGFTGKQVIHPAQVTVCQEAFSPSQAKIERARELISAFEAHQKSGKGAFNFRGTMIDVPTVNQARNVIQLAEVVERTKV